MVSGELVVDRKKYSERSEGTGTSVIHGKFMFSHEGGIYHMKGVFICFCAKKLFSESL